MPTTVTYGTREVSQIHSQYFYGQTNFQAVGPMIAPIMEEQPTMESVLRTFREMQKQKPDDAADTQQQPASEEIERAMRE